MAKHYQNEGQRSLKQSGQTDVPPFLAYVENDLFEDYLHDMQLVQRYAQINRKAMMDEIIKGMKLKIVD